MAAASDLSAARAAAKAPRASSTGTSTPSRCGRILSAAELKTMGVDEAEGLCDGRPCASSGGWLGGGRSMSFLLGNDIRPRRALCAFRAARVARGLRQKSRPSVLKRRSMSKKHYGLTPVFFCARSRAEISSPSREVARELPFGGARCFPRRAGRAADHRYDEKNAGCRLHAPARADFRVQRRSAARRPCPTTRRSRASCTTSDRTDTACILRM